jgi:large subunit ribosomal protein L18
MAATSYKKIRDDRRRGRLRRKASIRKKVAGTAERPRLSVFRSLKHIYVQAIDDTNNQVLAAASDLEAGLRDDLKGLKKGARARKIGEAIGRKLLDKAVKTVVFDRNGYMYHGRVKEVADGAREAGLEF